MKPAAPMQLDVYRPALQRLERRLLLKRSLSLGELTMLTSCNLQDNDAVDRVPCAPTYPASDHEPVPLNAFYPVDDAPEINGDGYALEVSGPYYSSIDMATTLHPQTILALDYGNASLCRNTGSR